MLAFKQPKNIIAAITVTCVIGAAAYLYINQSNVAVPPVKPEEESGGESKSKD